MNIKKGRHNNKILKKKEQKRLLLGSWMYEEDKEMKRKNVILFSGHIIHSLVPQIC
jgi:hypothetical protein